jgi:hypothetical protein
VWQATRHRFDSTPALAGGAYPLGVAERTPDDESDGGRDEALDADRLEADWKHALDAADEAVSAGSGSRLLGRSEVSAEAEHIRDERSWLRSFRPALQKLFPGRREAEPPREGR